MKGKLKYFKNIVFFSVLVTSASFAAEYTVSISQINDEKANNGMGNKIGTITFQDSKKGLLIKPNLKGLSPGKHGFHVHEKPSCEGGMKEGNWKAGMAAGDHLDPDHTQHHMGPEGQGHLGDLPVLDVNKSGRADKVLVAPRLTTKDIHNRTIMIHEGGDNYSDKPPMGGGGARIACGVVK